MGRQIGSFNNPNTGETDTLDVDTVGLIILQPRMITKVGETNQSAVEFKMGNDNTRQVLTLVAEYTNEGKIYKSKLIDIDEMEFAKVFADRIYSDQTIDDTPIMIEAKEKAMQDLTAKLMDSNILTGGMEFNGFGFITVDGDKVLSIENMRFDYSIENRKPIYSGRINHCVGNASMKNLNNPSVVFYTGKHKVQFIEPVVTETYEGRTKSYAITMREILVTLDNTMPEHQVFANPKYDDDMFLDDFIKSRKELLDDGVDNQKDLDDRFADLF